MKKTYILIAFLLFGVSAITNAQQKMPTAQELTVKDVDEMAERLKLSSTQKSVVYNYKYELYKFQMDLVKKQQAGTSKEDDVTKFYRLQNQTNDNIKTILKGEQLPEFEKLQEERLNGDNKKKKKKGKKDQEEVVTGIEGLKTGIKP
ncbi:hypothetical protein [Pedobacter frigoris]|uniref:DUF4890 domain-containing protein n=1 Tax=Pedobacter frigoris TaxID=2571272 RepID=A0A4U1CUF1_9SPHI|nr:hypothetical protein [Pedobacter frigoris]TKC09639.1 hypothetical protein FA047_06035 [Pedobacter frigoris]